MLKRMPEERGMAMVVALMVSFVLLLLTTVVVSQSFHDSTSSAYDRKRTGSIGAAEAGLNNWFAYLQSTPAASISCSPVTQTLNDAPQTGSFTATAIFYDASQAAMTCPFSVNTYPTYALITSVGSVNGEAPRTMTSYMKLTAVYGGFGAAILADAGTSFGNNFTLNGYNGNDGDIYILNGNLTISNSPQIKGNVYIPNGSVTMGNNSNIASNLWANTSVTINNPASVTGNVISSTSSISGSGSISGNATAGTTISGVSVVGTKTQNSVSSQPPSWPFPQITFDSTQQTEWTSAPNNYSIQTYSGANACSNAQSFVEGLSSANTTNYIVRITGPQPCTYTNTNNSTVTTNGSLAIISDWGIDVSNRSNWNATSATKNLYFISTYGGAGVPPAACPASGSAVKTVQDGNNTNFNSNFQVYFYSPCTVNMNNQNNMNGQVMGTNVNIANNWTMTFRPVVVPGVTTITSFKEDLSYIREVS